MSTTPRFAVLLLKLLGAAHCALLQQPKPTSPADNVPDAINGWTPRPTAAPALHRYGAMRDEQLFARAASLHTCGFYSGNSDLPFTCTSGSACGIYPAANGYPVPWFECCATLPNGEVNFSVCPYFSTCIGYYHETGSASPVTGSTGVRQNYRISCDSVSPYCDTWVITDTDGKPYSSYECGTETFIKYLSVNTTTGTVTASPATVTETKLKTKLETLTPSSPSFHKTKTTPSTGHGGHHSTNKSTATAQPTHHSKSETGAIVGGVVGGVAGLALIGAAIGYMVFRKKKQRVEPMREVSQYSPNY